MKDNNQFTQSPKLIDGEQELITEGISEEQELIPSWVKNDFLLGTNASKIRIANNNKEIINIDVIDNRISIPESSIISILYETPGVQKQIYEITPEKAKEIIYNVENAKILEENENDFRGDKIIGLNVSIILINSKSNYMKINMVIFEGGYIKLLINQENEEAKEMYMHSTELTNLLTNMFDVEIYDKEIFSFINSVSIYIIDNDKEYFMNEEEVENFKDAIYKAESINNFNTSCPFDVLIKANTTSGLLLNIRYSGDGCPIIGIEGQTYKLEKEYNEKFMDIVKSNLEIPNR
jgi:hypothetical protein